MNKKEKFSFLKGKGASVGIVLCFVAVIAMVGTVTFRNYKKNMNEQIAKVQQETEKLTKENDAAANSKDVLPMEGEEDATPSQTDHADRQEQEGASPQTEQRQKMDSSRVRRRMRLRHREVPVHGLRKQAYWSGRQAGQR